MNASLRELFREIADVPAQEREAILAGRRIPANLRAEVQSLLSFDSSGRESLTRLVSSAAEEALCWGSGLVSRRCGPYRLVRLLGAGGMGAVYLAERRDGEIEQKVAVKLLRADADRPAWRNRFLRERQLLAYLNHPSIARLLDAGHTDDGRPYLVMEHVDGVAIDEYAARLDLRSKLKLFLLVCDGVSHAHRHLIVHRDLKPSNILVDSAGHPKLLDFGIAKILHATVDQTLTVERLMTPDYASPEQLRGDVQSTATDIYSLGAVLHKLLTGRSPREIRSQGADERGAITAQKADPDTGTKLPRDIDSILQKALRTEADERYGSVDAFADDVRAYLESRPVQARSSEMWYRARKFVRRHRAAGAALVLTSGSLLLGLSIAHHQREIAEARVLQVRQLATKVLTLDEVAGTVDKPNKGLYEIVAMSKEHLEALGSTHKDPALALEVADAYSLLARAQGISKVSSSRQRTQAGESLQQAVMLVQPILSSSPANRKALLTAARISHDRMMVAENELRNNEAIVEARRAAAHVERFLALEQPTAREIEIASELLYDIALSHKNLNLAEEGIAYARRAVEISRSSPDAALRLSLGLSMLADLLRITGDLEGALVAIREARSNLENARFPTERERRSAWCRVLGREGKILGNASGMSLNRPAEAILAFQQAFDLLEEWTQNEREDAWSRLLFASVGRELGDVLKLSDPQRALMVYDHSLRRVREVQDNLDARRGEVELLAGSAAALRRLKRGREAEERIQLLRKLLSDTGDDRTATIAPHSEAYEGLRATADHFAETGRPQRAMEVYQDLLNRVIASKPDTHNDLRHALALSQIYESMAQLHRRAGEHNRSQTVAALRLELWRHWDRKLPNRTFVQRQLASARNL